MTGASVAVVDPVEAVWFVDDAMCNLLKPGLPGLTQRTPLCHDHIPNTVTAQLHASKQIIIFFCFQ